MIYFMFQVCIYVQSKSGCFIYRMIFTDWDLYKKWLARQNNCEYHFLLLYYVIFYLKPLDEISLSCIYWQILGFFLLQILNNDINKCWYISMNSNIGYDQSRYITKNFILYFCARNSSLQGNPTTMIVFQKI